MRLHRIKLITLLIVMLVTSVEQSVLAQQSNTLLYIVALALDNRPESSGNLELSYEATVAGLREATDVDTLKTAVLLVDLHDKDDATQYDHILVIRNGEIVDTQLRLPHSNGTLGESPPYEYNITDGEMLGGFIKWARETYPADTTTFTFVGHNIFAMPSTGLDSVFDSEPNSPPASPVFLPPIALQYNPWASPDYTDIVTTLENDSPRLLSPHALREALEIGTDDGVNPLAVVDMVHCFAASIEQFTELLNSETSPYSDTMVGGANYGYFSVDSLGRALSSIDPNANSTTIASQILNAHNDVLAEADGLDGDAETVEYPRSLTAVDTLKLRDVKAEFTVLADLLIEGLTNYPNETIENLRNAQQASTLFYDVSCDGEYVLDQRDALVDVGTFATSLETTFSPQSPIGSAAYFLKQATNEAVIEHIAVDGSAWFAKSDTSYWTLNQSDAVGLSLLADFSGVQTDDDTFDVSWYVGYYNNNVVEPLEFLEGSLSWSQVVQRYWEHRVQELGQTVTMSACLPEYPFVPQEAEVTAETITQPRRNSIYIGAEVSFGGTVTVDREMINPLVRFSVIDIDNQTVAYSTTLGVGIIPTGTHHVQASDTWTISLTTFAVQMEIDPENDLIEVDRSDNMVTATYTTLPADGSLVLTATLAITDQIVPYPSVPITIELSTPSVYALHCDVYALDDLYTPRFIHRSTTYSPESQTVTDCLLPDNAEAGIYWLMLIAEDGNIISNVVEIWVNYLPQSADLSPYDVHTFVFQADAGDSISFDLSSDQSVEMLIWEPGMRFMPYRTNETIILTAVVDGDYLVNIRETAGNTANYTFSLSSLVGTLPPDGIEHTFGGDVRPTFSSLIPEPLGSSIPTSVHITQHPNISFSYTGRIGLIALFSFAVLTIGWRLRWMKL